MDRRDVLKATAGTLALATIGHQAQTRSRARSYQPLGRIAIPEAKEAVVGPDGETAFVATTTGFATVDISTPDDLTMLAEQTDLVAEHENGPLRQIWDVKVEGDRLIVAGPASPLPDAVYGFLLYNVSDPATPERLAFHETNFPIHNCFFRDGLVYLTGNDEEGNPLVIVDVSDNTPTEVGRWSLLDYNNAWEDVHWKLRWLHDVRVQDDHAYLAYWDAGTWIVDVSEPADPKYITDIGGRARNDLTEVPDEDTRTEVVELPGNHHYVAVNDDGSLLGIGKEAWNRETTDRNGGPAGIELWDISDPASPQQLTTIEPPQPSNTQQSLVAAGFGIGDGVTHVGCHECGHREADQWTTAHNFDIVGERLFSSWYEGGVKIHDIGDPAEPKELTWWRRPDEASFWTAQLADTSFFIASSMGRNNNGKGALYTLPNEVGQ